VYGEFCGVKRRRRKKTKNKTKKKKKKEKIEWREGGEGGHDL
jgi:hypothetical protein